LLAAESPSSSAFTGATSPEVATMTGTLSVDPASTWA